MTTASIFSNLMGKLASFFIKKINKNPQTVDVSKEEINISGLCDCCTTPAAPEQKRTLHVMFCEILIPTPNPNPSSISREKYQYGEQKLHF